MAENKNKRRYFRKAMRLLSERLCFTSNEIQKLTGGYIKGFTLRQLDYEGRGIANRRLIGTIVVDDIEDLIEWLRDNTELINFDE